MIGLHGIRFLLGAACVFSTGCASVAERSPEADKVAVYESVPPGSRAYTLVRRVWTQSWQSAFKVPRYQSREEGASDLQNQAVALGGDAVMYFGCYRLDADSASESPGLICNGNVIRYGASAGSGYR